MKKKIVYIVGTRPEFIRSAHIINTLRKDKQVEFQLVHTGQHYDYQMNEIFFQELGLSAPDQNLNIEPGTGSSQISQIIERLSVFLQNFQPDILAVFGDTNSSLAAAIATVKMNIPLAHLEAGSREWEMDVPEEINRRIIDHCSNLLLAVSKSHLQNLKNENVQGKAYNIGDPQYAVFQQFYKKGLQLKLLQKLKLQPEGYILMTMHRGKNVDDSTQVLQVLEILNAYAGKKVVFPIHPRTKKFLQEVTNLDTKLPNILFLEPQGYIEMNNLLANCSLVVTDSGGLQKEAFWAQKPCITLRKHTGWSETVDLRLNFLCDIEKNKLIKTLQYVQSHMTSLKTKFKKVTNPYFQPDTTEKTVDFLKKFAGKKW